MLWLLLEVAGCVESISIGIDSASSLGISTISWQLLIVLLESLSLHWLLLLSLLNLLTTLIVSWLLVLVSATSIGVLLLNALISQFLLDSTSSSATTTLGRCHIASLVSCATLESAYT